MHLAKNYGNRAFRVHELPPLVFRACCPCKGSGYGSCGRRAFAPDAPTPVALGGEPRQVQRAGSNTDRGDTVYKNKRDWDYFTSTLTGIAFPAPPR
jgi:hypothetical protein